MAPKRRNATTRRGRDGPSRQSTRRPAKEQDNIPDVYQEMLAEAARNPLSKPDLHTKAVKRRRLHDGSAQVTDSEFSTKDEPTSPTQTNVVGDYSGPAQSKQIVFDDFAASDDDSDDAFEDVDLGADAEVDRRSEDTDEPLHLDLSKTPGPEITSNTRRRKPATAVERKLRLDVHKWHVLCLLAHLQRRNLWCDDDHVHTILKPLISRKTVKLLHLDSSQSQYQRNHSFNAAIDEISKLWRSKWTTTEQGMRRAYWKEEPDELKDVDEMSDLIDLEDFRDAAKTRSGSRDLGAQLFCALLRAVAVDTRLICSFQPLPFSGVAKGTIPEKPKSQYIMAPSLGRQPQRNQNEENFTPSNPSWRLYGAEPERSTLTPSKRPSKRIKDSPYPIFWVEVFNESLQKWIPVDPLVRNTINKPKTGFEPPANDALNNTSYVIAFEDDGSAKDVTRRYVQFYNGKTRRNRVDSVKGGREWWEKTMAFFEKPFPEDRDEIENAELSAREEGEQMPKNVQDFKAHPHYALERHLRRNEVIYPKREIGRVSVGQSRDAKLEPVFRRRDVLVVKTADQWYRLGRDVKIGEQPLKRVVSQKKRAISAEGEDDDEGEEGAMLYAEFQTHLYVPPNVVNGKIPKNAYGNLDVYVPSMIPAGGIHIRHPDAAKAAKILGISYVDAVTGFEFKGRQGTAVLNGIVVAAEYREALVEVLEAIAYERAVANSEKMSAAALQMWKRFLTALRIRERVHTKYAEAGSEAEDLDDEMEDETYENDDEVDTDEGGGGFFPEHTKGPATNRPSPETEPTTMALEAVFDVGPSTTIENPIVIHEPPHKLPLPQGQRASPPEREEEAQQDENPPRGPISDHVSSQNDKGGGFLLDDDDEDDPSAIEAKASSSSTLPFPLPTPDIRPHEAVNSPGTAPSINGTVAKEVVQEPEISSERTPPPPPPPPRHPLRSPPIHPGIDLASTSTLISPPSPHNDNANATNHHNNNEDESDSNSNPSQSPSQSSLLSHDPEDEDAEPDWLADMVEDSD